MMHSVGRDASLAPLQPAESISPFALLDPSLHSLPFILAYTGPASRGRAPSWVAPEISSHGEFFLATILVFFFPLGSSLLQLLAFWGFKPGFFAQFSFFISTVKHLCDIVCKKSYTNKTELKENIPNGPGKLYHLSLWVILGNNQYPIIYTFYGLL